MHELEVRDQAWNEKWRMGGVGERQRRNIRHAKKETRCYTYYEGGYGHETRRGVNVLIDGQAQT